MSNKGKAEINSKDRILKYFAQRQTQGESSQKKSVERLKDLVEIILTNSIANSGRNCFPYTQ